MSSVTNEVIDVLVQLGLLHSADGGGVEHSFTRVSTVEGNVVLLAPDDSQITLGSSSKFVRATGVAVACSSGVLTPQGLSAVKLLDTHSLVDTVNGTVLIPSDCTHFSAGLSLPPGWANGTGTYRTLSLEIEVIPGTVWAPLASISIGSLMTAGPNPGPVVELFPAGTNAGKKMRFSLQQDSGGSLTPTNLAFFAQFMTLP